MRLFIEPTEPLLFRTGRPFDAGSDVFAESIFPPTPETIQGALRATIAVNWSRKNKPSNKDDKLFQESALVNLIGIQQNYGRFRITGLTLGRRKGNMFERLFPAPTHIIQVKFKEDEQTYQLRLKPRSVDAEKVSTNIPAGIQYPLLPIPQGKKVDGKTDPISGWLTPAGLRKALRTDDFLVEENDQTEGDLVKQSRIFQYESRLGIGMQNATKTTREGYLYQVQMVRMQPDYGFIVDICLSKTAEYGGTETPQSEELEAQVQQKLGLQAEDGWLTLGGEQRAARFKVLEPSECTSEDFLKPGKEDNLLYLSTPAYFQSGWQPQPWPQSLPQPIAASIPRYERNGGWLLEPGTSAGKSKSIRRCVPAGSVYLFDKPITITQPLTEYGWQIGYGITFTGEWKR